jgi:hypothetical protein
MTPPCTKIPYPSPQAAHNALDDIRRRERNHGTRRSRRTRSARTERVYKCAPCNAWHITRGEWGSMSDLARGA